MMRAVAIAILVAGLVAAAHADPKRAEQYFHAGAEAFKKQSFAAAAENFELAYKEAALPEIAFSAAQAYRRQYFVEPKPEYVKRAVELYRIYLDKVKAGGRVGDASDGLAEMERELDKLTAHGVKIEGVARASTRLAVSVTIAGEHRAAMTELSAMPVTDTLGATATLDGKPIELFAPVEVEPGDHTVEVKARGYFPITQKRRVVEGTSDLVEVQLEPQPAHLTVKAEDGARIALDGRAAGAVQDVAAGHYMVAVTARGREPAVREIELGRGESRELDVRLHRTAKRRALPYLVGVSGGLVVLAAGVTTFALVSDSKMSDLERQRETTGITTSQLADYRTWTQRRDDSRDLAWILAGAAVATGATAAIFYWFDWPIVGEHVRAIAPTATPGGAGAAVVGRF